MEKPFDITLDWEHTEYQWVEREKLEKYDTTPALKKFGR